MGLMNIDKASRHTPSHLNIPADYPIDTSQSRPAYSQGINSEFSKGTRHLSSQPDVSEGGIASSYAGSVPEKTNTVYESKKAG